MDRTALGNSAYNHVTITNGFDFFKAKFSQHLIKPAENIIEYIDKFLWVHRSAKLCKPNNICKHDRNFRKCFSNVGLTLLEAICDQNGQYIMKQLFAVSPLLI